MEATSWMRSGWCEAVAPVTSGGAGIGILFCCASALSSFPKDSGGGTTMSSVETSLAFSSLGGVVLSSILATSSWWFIWLLPLLLLNMKGQNHY